MASNTGNDGQTTIDILLEKTTNIELSNNANNIRKTLAEILKISHKREASVRESTITLKINDDTDFETIRESIEKEWIEEQNESAVTFWKDREFAYAQFITKSAKDQFLDYLKMMVTGTPNSNKHLEKINERLQPPREDRHFKRREARVIMNNIKMNQKIEEIRNTLNKLGIKISDLKEGKPNEQTRSRAIMFRTDSKGIETIFGTLDGAIPYNNTRTGTRTRLIAKINVKPWQCRECYKIGPHACEGKTCLQCGNKGHDSKTCKTKTRYCANCKQKGHRAKDTHCSFYLNEVAKEIRKVDIPLDFYEDAEMRFHLQKYLQYK